jgi:PD-(D/E)XK nuclease superfamily
MPAISRELLAVLAAAAIALAVWQAVARSWTRRARRARILARVTRAGEGEAAAAALLEDLGFEVVGAQVAAEYPVQVDDETTLVHVRADYVVRKDGASYVVEVKTGAVAPRIATTATRRQLLEYRVAFDVDGVLLLDAEAGRLHAVTFPMFSAPAPERARGTFGWGLVAALVAAAALAGVAVALVSRSTP